MKKFLALILSVAMIFALVACGSKEGDTPNTDGDTQQTDTPAAPVDIVIATGGTTGTYYAVGNALVTTIGDKLSLSKLTAVDSGASKANVQLVTAGQAQMSILQSDVLNYAHNGSGGETMFDGAPCGSRAFTTRPSSSSPLPPSPALKTSRARPSASATSAPVPL